MFGTLAYVGGEPALGAFAVPIDKALYVAWVATSKTQRRLGLGQLVIRASLEDVRKATALNEQSCMPHKTGFLLPKHGISICRKVSPLRSSERDER